MMKKNLFVFAAAFAAAALLFTCAQDSTETVLNQWTWTVGSGYTLVIEGEGDSPATGDSFTLSKEGAECKGTLSSVTEEKIVFAPSSGDTFEAAIIEGGKQLSFDGQTVTIGGVAVVLDGLATEPPAWTDEATWTKIAGQPLPSNWVRTPQTAKVNVKGRPVINTVWCEGYWQDPRCAMGYTITGGDNDGKLYFDHFVQLYGGRLYNWDCALGTDANGEKTDCKKTGLHLHLDGYCKQILEDHYTYIKPIQDAGMKFLMGLVPAGGGVAHGTLYSWPMENIGTGNKWAEIYPDDPVYPFGPEAVKRLIDDIKEVFELYQIDGIGFDDEYASRSGYTGKGLGNPYPDGSVYGTSTQETNDCWTEGGKNMFRFMRDLHEAIPGIILEDYEIRYGQHIPKTWTDENGQVLKIEDYLSACYPANYGSWVSNPGSGNEAGHMPRSMFGPMPMDLGYSSTASNPKGSAVGGFMDDHLAGNYGVIMYYALYDHDGYGEKGYFGDGRNKPEEFFSIISKKLFGANSSVVYLGDNYRLPWN